MQIIDLAQLSLAGSLNPIAEEKILLWSADGTSASTTSTSAGGVALADGGTFTGNASTVHILNSKWLPNTKFAFEATIWSSSSSATAYAALWDTSAPGEITSSQISTTSTTATVVRSGQFTIPPGHYLEICGWTSTGTMYICDASLIVFP